MFLSALQVKHLIAVVREMRWVTTRQERVHFILTPFSLADWLHSLSAQ